MVKDSGTEIRTSWYFYTGNIVLEKIAASIFKVV